MKRRLERLVLCTALLTGLATVVEAQPRAWWKSEQIQKSLALSADQVSRIDSIFQAALPHLKKHRDELDRQEAELSRLIEMDADEVTVGKQVDKVEAVRGHLNKLRTLMLLHMREALTPDQRVRFKALRDQYERERKAAPNGSGDQKP
jgi:Spy/CpxP family protein refolding chaperone